MFSGKYNHVQELLLGDFSETSPAQQDRHPPKSVRSLRKTQRRDPSIQMCLGAASDVRDRQASPAPA